MPRTPVSYITSMAIGLLAVAAATAGATPVTHCDTVTPTLGADGTATVQCQLTEAEAEAATISIPLGTTRIDVTVRGGGGGAGGTSSGSDGYSGGAGARVVASLSPSVSTHLTVKAGGGGAARGPLMGGTGGGFSAIYEGASMNPSADSVIAVAGGGGGGGYGRRCASRGDGGRAGSGPDGAAETGQFDAPGIAGGGLHGSAGLGGVVRSPLIGTNGGSGSSWATGGAGGSGGGEVGSSDRGGGGGDGYGGGGGGGFVQRAAPVTCPPGPPFDAIATNDGSGGGGGGSYVKPERLIGRAAYNNYGGTGGSWRGEVSRVLDPALSGDVTLIFVGTTYTVTYDGNGATGGTVGGDHWGPYLAGYIVTVCDNHRTDLTCDFPNDDRLTRDGYTFDGWNTAADGSGTSYAPTDTFAITGNTVLYAQWKVLAATTSPSPPAAPVATPAASAPAITSPPVLRGAAVRCSGATCTTSGTLPAGATRVSQTATSGARTLSRELAWATAAAAKGTCKVNTSGKGKAVARTYTCRIRLTKGTWTVTTKALAPTSAVMAQAVKVARVK